MRDDVVSMALAGLSDVRSEVVAPDRWSLRIPTGSRAMAASLRRDGDWLALEARPFDQGGLTPITPATMLVCNDALPAAARVALDQHGVLVVLADVPLDADADVAMRLSEACADVARVAAFLDGGPPPDAGAQAPIAPDGLAALCERTGWPVRTLAGGALTVELDVRHGLHHAAIGARGGAIAVSGALVDDGVVPASPACARAVAIHALRVGGAFRLVRAAATEGAAAPRLEVLRTMPTAAELTHAFAALSLALGQATAAADALAHDGTLAAAYVRRIDAAGARRAA